MDLRKQDKEQGNGVEQVHNPILIVDDRDCAIRQYTMPLFNNSVVCPQKIHTYTFIFSWRESKFAKTTGCTRKCSSAYWMYFPHLITILCHRVDIPMSPIEPFTRPTRSVITENLYSQFIELQQKKNWEKGKRTKQRSDT
ncbi:hypothetical protein Goarm_011410 [Gossypium armourianum]|uniref:Uncharacterized protein n=1 Tax=Gossypium armourianum TaxID=34283 RepID=A0A7J9IWS2_9ROSI|nr:hypothetical protein [Gossypium armourianum]